ncbi:MAG: hypothetical protein Q4G63_09060 [Bacteroidia bacterium]|nr:hypothetical protein [Bacteroidia bacterium]
MKKLFICFVLFAFASSAFTQQFDVPENYKLEKAEDYPRYEQDVINAVDWLVQTPLNQQVDKRKNANAFVLKWLMGSPYTHVEIRPEIVTFLESSPDLLIIFLGGWAKHALQTKKFDDKVEGNLAGLQAAINFYQQNKLPKDKNIEKFIKLDKQQKLLSYIENVINKK